MPQRHELVMRTIGEDGEPVPGTEMDNQPELIYAGDYITLNFGGPGALGPMIYIEARGNGGYDVQFNSKHGDGVLIVEHRPESITLHNDAGNWEMRIDPDRGEVIDE